MENIKLILSVYDIIYIICNLFNTYVVSKLMRVVFDKVSKNKKIEIFSYIVYFIITTLLYLFINIPFVLLISNIFMLFFISFNYHAKMKVRIFYTIFMYLLLMLIEELIALISGYTYNTIYTVNSYSSIWGVILIKIISFIVVNILEKHKNKKLGMDIPLIYWLCICMIPFISLCLIYILFQNIYFNNIQLIICITLLLFENFVVFYLYDVITIMFENKSNSMLIEQQNKLYYKQLKLMQISLQSAKDIRHDLKNHLSMIQTLANDNNIYSILNYIDQMSEFTNLINNISNSNNVIIDSIINFKYEEASKIGIEFNIDISVPTSLNIEAFDMTVILGNLIDNSIQAVKLLNNDKIIYIKIKYDKGRLLIKVINRYEGKIKIISNRLETTKSDKDNHGIGLKNIEKSLEKYKGEMDISTKNNIFYVSIIIYVS